MIRKPKRLGEYAAMLAIWIGPLLLFGALATLKAGAQESIPSKGLTEKAVRRLKL